MNENLRSLVTFLAEQFKKGKHEGLAEKFAEACELIAYDMGVSYSEACGVFFRTLAEKHGIQTTI
jgi:hypothetical protein